jgi:flagellar assembly protein FliH
MTEEKPRMGPAEVMAMIRASSAKGFEAKAPLAPADAIFRRAKLEEVKRVDPGSGQVIEAAVEMVEAEVLPPAPEPVVVVDPAKRLAEARAEGYAAGHADGVEEGLSLGRAEGRSAAEAELAPARGAFLAAAARLTVAGDPAEDIAEVLAAAVRRLAAERAGQMIDSLPAAFAARVESLADRVAQGVREVSLRLNPDDLSAITPHLAGYDVLGGAVLTADPRLARGDVEVRAEGIRLADLIGGAT